MQKIKNFYQSPIKAYQYISKMLPASCRYYPSCSEYASWQFAYNTPSKAFLASGSRILSCNPFFAGGIDYPLVAYSPHKTSCVLSFNRDCGTIKIYFWFVPQTMKDNNKNYYILKDFDAINAEYSP